jgi:hypothetical protein
MKEKGKNKMKFILNVTIPNKEFNAAVKDGSAGEKLGKIMDSIEPEGVYFTTQEGQRGVTMIVNLENAAEVPRIAEPWFLTFNAKLDIKLAMSPEDLAKAGLEEMGKLW